MKQMRNRFPQHRFDGARRVAQFPSRFLGRQCPRPQCDTNAFGRTGRRSARHVICDEFQHCSGNFGNSAANLKAASAAATDRFHEFENLCQLDGFAAQDIAMSGLSAFHRQNQPFGDIAHIDEVNGEIEIQLKTTIEKMAAASPSEE